MITTKTTQSAFKLLFAALLCFAVTEGQAQEEEDATSITVTEVLSNELSPIVPAAGTVFSRNETQITAGMAGRLKWLAEPGDYVEAGTSVATFDCEMLGLQRERQVAEAGRAKINFDRLAKEVGRLTSVSDASAIAEIQLDRTVADRDLAGSDFTIANINIRETDSQLSRCSIRAPFSGVVTQRLRNAGEDVERSTVLAAMTDTENLEVRASVPIRYLPRMQEGAGAEVRLNELRLEARIRKVVPAANSQSQTFEVRLDLPANAPRVVAAGQLVSVSLPLSANLALTVPRDSVILREDGAFVMRINEDAKAERIAVEIREASGDQIAVTGELQSGDRIAVRGAEALDDGDLVAVQTET
jgi:membrane fusion protein, multidrug efflux system